MELHSHQGLIMSLDPVTVFIYLNHPFPDTAIIRSQRLVALL